MIYYARLDSDKRIELLASEEDREREKDYYDTQELTEVDVPDGFDFDTSRDYIVEDGALVYSPPPLTAEDEAAIEQAERYAQIDAAVSLFVKTSTLTDAQALTVSAFYDKWDPSSHYSAGDRVRYDGKLWKCREEHDAQESWTPADAHSLWGQILEPGTVPEWEQPQPGIFDGYEKGQHVMLDGVEWVSIYDGLNVWKPGDIGTESLWERA